MQQQREQAADCSPTTGEHTDVTVAISLCVSKIYFNYTAVRMKLVGSGRST